MPAKSNINHNVVPAKALFLIAFLCFALLVALLVFAGQQNAHAPNNQQLMIIQDAKVEVIPVKIQDRFLKPRTVYGRVESLRQANIGFELTGLVDKILVIEGQLVTKGHTLANLDTARLQARKNELKSELQSAKANATLAKLSTQRFSELVSKKLESQQQLDESIANLDASNALVTLSKAKLVSLEVELNKSKLLAPFDGQITRQLVDEGTVVNSGVGIFTILETGSLEARFGLPEQTAYKLKQGQEIAIQASELTLTATVKSITSQRNFATRTIEAVLSIDQDLPLETMQLVSGDLASLSIDIPIEKKGAWVPLSSLASAVRGLWTIYVVTPEQRIEKRLVSIEFSDTKFAYISGAIAGGDKVVVSGVHRLAPNQAVTNVHEVSIQREHVDSQQQKNEVVTSQTIDVNVNLNATMDD